MLRDGPQRFIRAQGSAAVRVGGDTTGRGAEQVQARAAGAAAWSCLDVLPPSLHVWPQHGRVGRCAPPPGQPGWPLTPLGKLQQETWVPSDRGRSWQKQLCSPTLGGHPRRTEGTPPPPPPSPPVRASPVAGGRHMCVPSRPVSPRANAPVRVNPSVCMPLARAARSKQPRAALCPRPSLAGVGPCFYLAEPPGHQQPSCVRPQPLPEPGAGSAPRGEDRASSGASFAFAPAVCCSSSLAGGPSGDHGSSLALALATCPVALRDFFLPHLLVLGPVFCPSPRGRDSSLPH